MKVKSFAFSCLETRSRIRSSVQGNSGDTFAKALGGIRFKLTRQWFRIDTIQHVASFYLKHLLFESQLSNKASSKLSAFIENGTIQDLYPEVVIGISFEVENPDGSKSNYCVLSSQQRSALKIAKEKVELSRVRAATLLYRPEEVDSSDCVLQVESTDCEEHSMFGFLLEIENSPASIRFVSATELAVEKGLTAVILQTHREQFESTCRQRIRRILTKTFRI
ncbi:MAG: hypothetical protein AB8B50_19215 [Pirellulaceae bacterium]